jgi:hypothetical protein
MSKETQAIDTLIKHIKLSIHTFAPARVVSFNESKQEADIEVLFMAVDKYGGTSKYPLIPAVPVLGMRYKIKQAYPATVTGLTDEDGSVNGSAATIKPKQEVVYTPHLLPGDIVFVAFSERAIDNLQAKPFDPGYRRMFDMRDAVIVGGFKL